MNKVDELKKVRGTEKITNLCSGPGKLCQAFSIDRRHNGLELGKNVKGNEVIVFDDGYEVENIATSSRVGIKDALDLPWRFYVEGNEFVSKG